MKKILSLVLVVVLLLAVIPTYAEEIYSIGLAGDKLSVTDKITVTDKEVTTMEPPTTYFSFASDSFHNGPTFKGAGGTNTFFSDAEVSLNVDLNNDNYGGLVTFLSRLKLHGETYDYRVYDVGNKYLHVWKVYSEMSFTHVNPSLNSRILDIGFKEGVLTSWSPSPYTLGETMTLQDSQSADESMYMKGSELLNGIGVPEHYLNLSKDVAFTFTNVRAINSNGNANNLVNIDKEGNFKDDWKSEGSFSASSVACK